MKVEFDRKDFKTAQDFIHNGELVTLMNEQGLTFGAMAWILDTLFKAESEMEARLIESEAE